MINFFGEDNALYNAADKAGQSQLYSLSMQSALRRDLAVDSGNPEEKLPADLDAEKQMDIVPMFGWTVGPDQSTPSDYQLTDSVKMYQDAFKNSTIQDNLFTDPKVYGLQGYNTEGQGKAQSGAKQKDVYSNNYDGSAAGMISNYLKDDEFRENSVESMTAF